MFEHGLLFGAFDGLHPGHLSLLNQAKNHTKFLTIALATDDTLRTLKGHGPAHSFDERKTALLESQLVHEVVESVADGEYSVITIAAPNVLILGYDQDKLEADLRRWLESKNLDIPLIKLDSFSPELYKSSILYDRS